MHSNMKLEIIIVKQNTVRFNLIQCESMHAKMKVEIIEEIMGTSREKAFSN